MTRLNDTQRILLSSAAARTSGSLYPLPDTINDPARGQKRVDALLKRELVEVRETSDRATSYRSDDDTHFGVFLTDAGKVAIGAVDAEHVPGPAPAPALEPDAPRLTKASAVIALLQRTQGATLPELIEATGWLPHTTRAALTGLRKKGHELEKSKRDEHTCDRIAAAPATDAA